jgi:uncharacterized membrane protein YGL010W
VAVVLFFVVGLAVIPVLALLMTFRCATMACSKPGWEAQSIAMWVVAWPIAWVFLAAAFYRKRHQQIRKRGSVVRLFKSKAQKMQDEKNVPSLLPE